jgi:hypothetical protein
MNILEDENVSTKRYEFKKVLLEVLINDLFI